MNEIIKIEHLSKSFGNVKAVDDLSFSVKQGELFAFLGENGAGKSTTISIICSQQKSDSGTVFINGFDVKTQSDRVKRDIGVVFQSSVLDMPLSVYDNLINRAALYGIRGKAFRKRLDELVCLFKLEEVLKRSVGKLSGGERRKTDIARALLHEPKLLILDEPTTGLDPKTRKKLWDAVELMRREKNMTVLLTTHYMEEAAQADNVVIIDSGKICASGTPIELKNAHSKDCINVYGVLEESIKTLNIPYEHTNSGYKLIVDDTKEAARLIAQRQDIFIDFEVTKGRMDDVFLAVTGKKLSGGENK